VGLAYLWHRDRSPVDLAFVDSGTYAVNVGGGIHAVTVGRRAPVDPANQRVRR
jgi:hypothetical protein